MSVKRNYAPGLARLEGFLARVGRRKFVRPIFEALKETPAGLDRARALFASCSPNWHPITRASIAALLA
jgi:hypothetical protein